MRGKAYVEFGLEHPEHYRLLMMTTKARTPEELGEDSPGMTAFQHLVDAVQRCIEAKVFTDTDALTGAFVLWAGVHGITSLLITFPAFEWGDRDQVIDLILDVQIEGLLAV